MIDFQSRDTGRGRDEEEEESDGGDSESTEDRDEHSETGGDHHGHADHDHHDHHDHDVETVSAAVVTVSSSRSLDDDPAGETIAAALENAGHEVVTREIVGDEFRRIQNTVEDLCDRSDVDIVVTTGGTGVTPDDVTIEAVSPLFDKELPGFGELFRILSHEEIGTKIIGTRATGGIADGVPVFCLPGSQNAARLGAEQLIVKEAGHLAGLATRHEN